MKQETQVKGRLGRIWKPIGFFICMITLSLGVAVWLGGFSLGPSDPLFRGKPESEWIAGLKYWDEEQVNEWRGYGEEGVQVLIRGLENADRSGERNYRNLYSRMPKVLRKWLPAPKQDSTRTARMCLAFILSSIGDDAKSATPIMIRTVIYDEDEGVRQLAINFLTSSEDENCILNQLSPAQKSKLLPALIRDLRNGQNWGLRNNAANALMWFPEQQEIVSPALVVALNDPQPQVRLLVAAALLKIDKRAVIDADVDEVLVGILNDPDPQVAHRAAGYLPELQTTSGLVVPALIEALDSTNTLVACSCVWALKRITNSAELILPALQLAATREDNAGGWARKALEEFQPAPRSSTGKGSDD